jgi:hypothetical protein
MASVNIAGLDKAVLLTYLTRYARRQRAPCTDVIPHKDIQVERVRADIQRCEGALWVETYRGRAIHCDIGGDAADSSSYDRINGKGMFAFVVSGLRT